MLPQIFQTQPTDNSACALATRVDGYGVSQGRLDYREEESIQNVGECGCVGVEGNSFGEEEEWEGGVLWKVMCRYFGGIDLRGRRRGEAEKIGGEIKKFSQVKSTRTCGVPRFAKSDEGWNEVWEEPGKDGRSVKAVLRGDVARFLGLYKCKKRWGCWECGTNHVMKAVREYTATVELFKEKYPTGSTLLLTTTLQHSLADKLGTTRRAVTEVWTYLFNNSFKTKLEKEFGYLGYFRGLDVTHSFKNGYHPHIHGVIFFDRELSEEEIVKLFELIFKRWERRLKKQYGARVNRDCCTLEVPRSVEDLASYVARSTGIGGSLNVSREVVGSVTKTAKEGHRSLSQIFRDAALVGQIEDINLCHEIEMELSGAQMLTCSGFVQSLRKESVLRLEKERKEAESKEEVVLDLPMWFYKVCRDEGWCWRVLRVCEYANIGVSVIEEGLVREWTRARVCTDWRGFVSGDVRMAPKNAFGVVQELLFEAERRDEEARKEVLNALGEAQSGDRFRQLELEFGLLEKPEIEDAVSIIGANETALKAPARDDQ